MSMAGKRDNKDFLCDDDSDGWLFSLNKFVGKKVVDVVGFPSDPFGDTPLFRVYQIVFDDGTKIHVEGEHDVAYIPANDKLKNMDDDTLQEFIEKDEEE